MKVYEEVSEEVKIGNSTYLVEGCHRDWNPLPGTTPPEGTVWELVTMFEGRKVVGAGSSKGEALANLLYAVGFQHGVNAATLGPNRPV